MTSKRRRKADIGRSTIRARAVKLRRMKESQEDAAARRIIQNQKQAARRKLAASEKPESSPTYDAVSRDPLALDEPLEETVKPDEPIKKTRKRPSENKKKKNTKKAKKE